MIKLSDYRHIHCVGIGGIGLSAIAEILLDRGYIVSGSDMKESEITDKLIEKGARIFLGHREKNVEGADLLVYSAAVGETNPERVRAEQLGILQVTRAELLGVLMDEYKKSIAVSGTHGKTTTTSMISLVLANAQKDPTILVGGNLEDIKGNARVGKSQFFITEACEYMDSFLSLRPNIEIILNIDSDHLDYFKDVDHIVSSFKKFTSQVSEGGKIIAYDANPFVNAAVNGLDNVITFGLSNNCDYYARDIAFNESGRPVFNVYSKENKLARVQLAIPGEHNILNSLATFACCHSLGIKEEIIADTLSKFTGTQRRFDIVGTTMTGVQIIDDYAHHPTEIKATLSAAQNVPHKSLWCLFQPHTYTRTIALFDEFAQSFGDADKLVIAEIYAAREKNIHKISSEALAQKIKELHPEKYVCYISDFEKMSDYIMANAEEGDIVITMGAGDIYKVGEMIFEKEAMK